MISCASVRPQVRQARDKKAQKLDLECHAILRHQRALRVVRVGALVKRPQYDNGEKQRSSAISSPPARITRPVRAWQLARAASSRKKLRSWRAHRLKAAKWRPLHARRVTSNFSICLHRNDSACLHMYIYLGGNNRSYS